MGQALERFHGRKVDRAGDGLFATFDGPGRAIRCACEISREVRRLGLEIRTGIRTGEWRLHALLTDELHASLPPQ